MVIPQGALRISVSVGVQMSARAWAGCAANMYEAVRCRCPLGGRRCSLT